MNPKQTATSRPTDGEAQMAAVQTKPTCPTCGESVPRGAQACGTCRGTVRLTPTAVVEQLAAGRTVKPELARQMVLTLLREARIRAGNPTTRTIAKELNGTVCHTTVWRLFKGRSLSTGVALAVAEALGVQTHNFYKVLVPLLGAAEGSSDEHGPGVEIHDCPRCGRPYTDLNQHIGWHVLYEPANTRPVVA